VGDKLDSRIKSGEIKESELISEAASIMNRMKNMPGMENIESMLKNMGIPGLNKNTKLNTGAMEAQMNRNLKTAQMKERMKAKLEATRLQKEAEALLKEQQMKQPSPEFKPVISDEQLISIFNAGEKGEKTPRNAKPPTGDAKKAKKKKGKK
jgi:ketol-acid reductoisomerase